jgi:hypothetical protein
MPTYLWLFYVGAAVALIGKVAWIVRAERATFQRKMQELRDNPPPPFPEVPPGHCPNCRRRRAEEDFAYGDGGARMQLCGWCTNWGGW